MNYGKPKTRTKILLICAAILIGSYVARYFILTSMRRAYFRQRRGGRNRTLLDSRASGQSPCTPIGNCFAASGRTRPDERTGRLHLRLELKQNEPEKYTGFSRFSCINLATPSPQDVNITTMANRVNLDTAIMQGAVEKGSIRLHSDKTFGMDLNGCAVTDMTVTPFGNGGAVAEWQEGTCPGGNLLMQRTR